MIVKSHELLSSLVVNQYFENTCDMKWHRLIQKNPKLGTKIFAALKKALVTMVDRYFDTPLKSAAVSGHQDVVAALATYAREAGYAKEEQMMIWLIGKTIE